MLLERARVREEAQVEIADALQTFPSHLPTARDSAYAAWVSISVGCNNTCTFCIVPALRGKEVDRRPGEILAEIEMLVADGVQEITLLGQNVNAYGVDFGDRSAFAKLLRRCGEVPGLERVRFTSPHPKDFTDEVIAAMAETPNVMPSLHMPLQSGSDAVLRAMRRSYRSERFLGIIDRVRAAMPEAAITTDIIVGFPGETEADFQATLDVVAAARFAGAFTFQYSIRAGTPAATMPDQVPKAVVQERYERLVALVEEIAWRENQTQVGRPVEVHVRRRRGSQGRRDRAYVRPGPGQPPGPRDRARRPGRPAPSRRHRRDGGHLRRPPPPERRRRPRPTSAAPPAATPGPPPSPAPTAAPPSASASRPSAPPPRSHPNPPAPLLDKATSRIRGSASPTD